ncbi:DotI/IcmL family type IV secretion protein [Microbulbifer epialgicus]|uniref:DotI/IcmL family type IV secretion protein n=1 Tax=Microbulbifer epialgicus TaxID=393907 RepID=A0ABV4NTH7_9GAMM
MTNKLDEAVKKHQNARLEEQKKLEQRSARHMPGNEVPASAQIVFDDKEWRKNFSKLTLFALLFSLAAAAAVSATLAYVLTRPPETLSYAVDEDGRVVPLMSVRDPSLTETEVLNWAAEKVNDIHRLSFTDYVDHIQSQRADFTVEAFDEYQRALLASKSLEKVKAERLTMWSEPKEAPKILSAKVVNGKFTWVVEMRIIQYLGGGEYVANGTEMVSTIVVERTSRARNLSGVVISKYLAKEIGS